MDHGEILANIRNYIVNELLDGNDEDLENDTPLLEWGIINSMELTRLIAFIADTFSVQIPEKSILPSNFKSLISITDLVLATK